MCFGLKIRNCLCMLLNNFFCLLFCPLAMHTPAPVELFISGAIPGSRSFPSSSPISAYQHPIPFPGKSFTPSLSLQEVPTYSSNGLRSPHDSVLHIKTSPQSSLGFDRLLSSQSTTYRETQEPPAPQNQSPSVSSNCHLSPPHLNPFYSQLHNRSSQLNASSTFSSVPALRGAAAPQPDPAPERVVPRQDSVIKHYQRSPPPQSTSLQQYAICGGSSRFQQLVSEHQHGGMPFSPQNKQTPSNDPKPSPQVEPQSYQPAIQIPYTTSSSKSSVSSSARKGSNGSSSISSYSSSGSLSSTRTPQTQPSPSSSSSNYITNSNSLSCQQPVFQLPSARPLLPLVSSTFVQQPTVKRGLPSYSSQSLVKSSILIPNQTTHQPHVQSYSPTSAPSAPMAHSVGGFSSSPPQDLSSGGVLTGGKTLTSIGPGGHSLSAENIFGDSSYDSVSLRRASSPSLEYGNESSKTGCHSGATTQRGVIRSVGSGSASPAVVNESNSTYPLPESSTSPIILSTLSHSTLHSPAAVCHSTSPESPGGTKYLTSMLSSAFMSLPQSFPDARQTQSDPYHHTPTKPKTDGELLATDQSPVEAEEVDYFIIQHLLHTQRSTPYSSQHNSHSHQLSQLIPQARDGGSKVMTFDINKISKERHHPQSVFRTNNSTNHSGPKSTISETASGLNNQLESTPQKQQSKSKLTVSKSPGGKVQGVSKSLSCSLTIPTDHKHHKSLESVVQYEIGDGYTQHPQHQHSYLNLHVAPYSQQHTQHSQQNTQHSQHNELTQYSHHSQSTQANSQSQNNLHMRQKKPLNTNENAYLCNKSDLLQICQSQTPISLTDSSPDPLQSTHMMQPVLCHTPCTPQMDFKEVLTQQQQQKHHPLKRQGIISTNSGVKAGGLESNSQHLSPQLRLPLENQGINTHNSLAVQSRDQLQTSHNSIPPVDVLDQSLSQVDNTDTGEKLDRSGLGMTVCVGERGCVDRYNHQHRHMPQHHSQQKHPDLNNLHVEPDLGASTSSHLHSLNPPPAHTHSRALQGQQAHAHHRLSNEQLGHSQPDRIQRNMAQQREHETRLPPSKLDQRKQHLFDTFTPVNNVGQDQILQQRFPSPTSICVPDSLLQNEERSFFPEMEDIFCQTEYKLSCVRDSGAGQAVPESLSQSHRQSQEGIEAQKSRRAGENYDVGNHRTDEVYGQYCHTLPGTGNSNQQLDLESVKTHKLPSTVNTDQLGFIQSQNSSMALGSAAQQDGSAHKILVAEGESFSITSLTSPIFCPTRPKKLLKTSSFHFLKQRREPQPQKKKNYLQEYEFEDDEDKADTPADIRLNSRRLPDLLPDLVSSCGRATGTTGLSPMTSYVDFCPHSSYTPRLHHSQILPHNGPKKRGRKPTKPKREGPPRPRGRPRIRPLPEPPYCRALMGSAAGEARRGRGRGKGRGRREEPLVDTHRDINKAQSIPHQQQQHQQQCYSQQQHVQQYPQQHFSQQSDLHQAPDEHVQHHLHHQQQVSFSHHQLHRHQLNQQEQQHTPQKPQQELAKLIKVNITI